MGNNKSWGMSETGSYFSYHINETYLGDEYPKYHVLENPDGYGWVIGQFYTFIGEYVPLEEDGEETLVFSSVEEAMNYIDYDLENMI